MAEAAVEISKEIPTAEGKQPPVKNLKEDAFQNFLQGKRHMLVKDYSHAVQSLAEACELYVEHYGPLAHECGEVYYLYGKALFNYFQQQAGIFGDSPPDEEEEEEEENGGSEDDKDEEKGEEENEDSNDKEDDSESISSSKDGEKCEVGKSDSQSENNANDNEPTSTSDSSAMDTSVPKPQAESSEANEASEANGVAHEVSKDIIDAAEAGPSQSNEKTEDEISDLQLAWENLETAKSIFQKQGDQKENELKVAEILLLLGEISLECDNYDAACRDLKEALIIWQKHLSPDDRRIAETFYQLGLAHQLSNQSDKAIDYFQHTIDVIQLRIGILKKQQNEPAKQNEDGFDIDPSIEIADLEALIPDIKSKMEDTKDIDKDTKKAMEEFVTQKIDEVNVTSTSDEKPVSNISHLLKRKKPEEPDNTKTEGVKRVKLSSPATNVEEQRPSSSEATSPSRA